MDKTCTLHITPGHLSLIFSGLGLMHMAIQWLRFVRTNNKAPVKVQKLSAVPLYAFDFIQAWRLLFFGQILYKLWDAPSDSVCSSAFSPRNIHSRGKYLHVWSPTEPVLQCTEVVLRSHTGSGHCSTGSVYRALPCAWALRNVVLLFTCWFIFLVFIHCIIHIFSFYI